MTSPSSSSLHHLISPTEEIIEEAREGRMFILVDDEDRENEGDLIIPAQMATPSAINFMAKNGRGLICLCLTRDRCEQLDLPPMVRENGTPLGTAFTVSIEAREGITTGISAADRARTVAVAIDGNKGRADITSPGHVFPLQARDGGVLVRTGHTEAGVDISRLAGLNPSAVICEIMKEDGTMARMSDLASFAQLHGLKIGTIRDLIAYRLRHDHNIERVGEARFTSHWGGEWRVATLRNKALGRETLAIIKGDIAKDEPTLVRMHSLDVFPDTLRQKGDREGLLGRAMTAIAEHGSGIVVLLMRSNLLSDAIKALSAEETKQDTTGLRDYGVGAQILAELGVHDMILLSNSHHDPVALGGYGLNIVAERQF